MKRTWLFLSFAAAVLTNGCVSQSGPTPPPPDRETLIPAGQVKIEPESDHYEPISMSAEYEKPVPLPYPLNTAGAEDSAFILPDGQTLYLWFTPDPQKPPEMQVTDGVTGIYVSRRLHDDLWSTPIRVLLQDPGKLALDGCEFILGDIMWFCTAREGYTGVHWFNAVFREGAWQDWQLADFDPAYQVGELHITANGQELYFHSSRPGGLGGYDLWVSQNVNGEWQEPVNLANLNSPTTDGWPFVTYDGSELWFTHGPGAPELWRSKRVNGEWSAPEQMFTNFAGEASLDNQGNVYFTHHFYENDRMLEADIYVAKKRTAGQ